jgi:hypothetical protein
MLQLLMLQFMEQFSGVTVGKMPGPALDVLFQRPGTGPGFQHLRIVIGLGNQQCAAFSFTTCTFRCFR